MPGRGIGRGASRGLGLAPNPGLGLSLGLGLSPGAGLGLNPGPGLGLPVRLFLTAPRPPMPVAMNTIYFLLLVPLRAFFAVAAYIMWLGGIPFLKTVLWPFIMPGIILPEPFFAAGFLVGLFPAFFAMPLPPSTSSPASRS